MLDPGYTLPRRPWRQVLHHRMYFEWRRSRYAEWSASMYGIMH
jgi:hypothetical protein